MFDNLDIVHHVIAHGSMGMTIQSTGPNGQVRSGGMETFRTTPDPRKAATVPALQAYRATFNPSETLDRPYTMVATAVVAAETDERAKYLAAPHKLAMARQRAGNPSTYPTPEEAAANPLTPEQQALLGGSQSAAIVGSVSITSSIEHQPWRSF